MAKRLGIAILLGSSPDALRIRAWRRTADTRLVVINNAWALRPDWDFLVHPEDFPARRLPQGLRPDQRLIGATEFVPAQNDYGGFVYAGGTMAFTAAYWALSVLKPKVMAFLGCDMIYPASGRTHFYGRGAADPLRDDPTLQSLEAKSARLASLALAEGTICLNLSELAESRLIFPRLALAEMNGPDERAIARLEAEARANSNPQARTLALARERALGYRADDGRYWRQIARFDPAELAALDRLWLRTGRSGQAAA